MLVGILLFSVVISLLIWCIIFRDYVIMNVFWDEKHAVSVWIKEGRSYQTAKKMLLKKGTLRTLHDILRNDIYKYKLPKGKKKRDFIFSRHTGKQSLSRRIQFLDTYLAADLDKQERRRSFPITDVNRLEVLLALMEEAVNFDALMYQEISTKLTQFLKNRDLQDFVRVFLISGIAVQTLSRIEESTLMQLQKLNQQYKDAVARKKQEAAKKKMQTRDLIIKKSYSRIALGDVAWYLKYKSYLKSDDLKNTAESFSLQSIGIQYVPQNKKVSFNPDSLDRFVRALVKTFSESTNSEELNILVDVMVKMFSMIEKLESVKTVQTLLKKIDAIIIRNRFPVGALQNIQEELTNKQPNFVQNLETKFQVSMISLHSSVVI